LSVVLDGDIQVPSNKVAALTSQSSSQESIPQ
jgi:hypothetical protein